jgi:predicted phosphohydrolase
MDSRLMLATANQILKYLQRYPASADVVQGVHTYWLDWGCSPEHLCVTQAALHYLREAGSIECIDVDAGVLWRQPAGCARSAVE